MFWNKKSILFDRFFSWDVKIKETIQQDDRTQYILESWDYEFSMLVFNTWSLWMSWQGSLKKNWNIIPLEIYEFKMFSKELDKFLRK